MSPNEIIKKIKKHLYDKQHESIKIGNNPLNSENTRYEAAAKVSAYFDIEQFLETIDWNKPDC